MKFLQKILRFFNLLPCPACGEGDGNGVNDFCLQCRKNFGRIDPATRCRGCGGERKGVLAVCPLCLQEKKRPWLDALSLFRYEKEAREMILKFKSGDHPVIARPLGKIAAETLRAEKWHFDVIVPIPLHFTRLWKRTYNQAELFARQIGRNLGIYTVNALERRYSQGKQAARNRAKRHQNTQHLFAVKDFQSISGKEILLVDDVFTTGATCDAAARILLQAGAKSVRILTICRAVGHGKL
ncbi:MAG: ComF family protein [Victivallaceae bacterium]|nr:ComF family protein [Victivallaceae bacterium]